MNGIKIISDGTGYGTKVFTKDGVDISNSITSISITIKPDKPAYAELTFIATDIEVDAVTDSEIDLGVVLTNLDGSQQVVNCG